MQIEMLEISAALWNDVVAKRTNSEVEDAVGVLVKQEMLVIRSEDGAAHVPLILADGSSWLRAILMSELKQDSRRRQGERVS